MPIDCCMPRNNIYVLHGRGTSTHISILLVEAVLQRKSDVYRGQTLLYTSKLSMVSSNEDDSFLNDSGPPVGLPLCDIKSKMLRRTFPRVDPLLDLVMRFMLSR